MSDDPTHARSMTVLHCDMPDCRCEGKNARMCLYDKDGAIVAWIEVPAHEIRRVATDLIEMFEWNRQKMN